MRAIITGASSGIGLKMAHILARKGYCLTLVARREDRLKKLAKSLAVPCQIFAYDLSNEDECKQLYEKAHGDDVEILINNAGFGLFGHFSDTDLDREMEMIKTNITAVHILTKLFLKDFKRKNSGYILNVASSAGFMAGPLMSTYYATKNYVLRLSQAINEELRREKSKVKVSALCPGPVETEFNSVANVKFSLGSLSSSYVAQYALDKMFEGKGVIVPGVGMKITLAARHLVPEWIMPKITYNIQHKKSGSKK